MSTDPNRVDVIRSQVKFNEKQGDSTQPEKTGNLKAEQAINDFPDYAEVKRGYAKWTDNNGVFHKVPLEGTTALRSPAHEQHDLALEDRDNLDQASANKTPRRDNALAEDAFDLVDEDELLLRPLPEARFAPKDSEEPKDVDVEVGDSVDDIEANDDPLNKN